jgi:hypothetical protein
MPLSKGGATTLSQPRSSSTMRGTSHGYINSCKKRIWSRRNSRSDCFLTNTILASSAKLRQGTTLLVM